MFEMIRPEQKKHTGTKEDNKKSTLFSIIFSIIKTALKKNKKFLFISGFVLFVMYTFLYGIWKIPLIGLGINRLSPVTFTDYVFLFIITGLTASFITLWRYERKQHFSSNSKMGGIGGSLAGIISGVCPVCQSIGFVAFGTTFLNIPTAFLTPFLGIIKILSVGLLGLAVILKADSIRAKTCRACLVIPLKNQEKRAPTKPLLFRNDYLFGGIFLLIALLFINQMLIPQAYASVSVGAGGGWGTMSLGNFEYGSKITLKPMPLAAGEQPKIPSYKSIVKPLPTISELAIKPATGDPVQDLLNNVVPTGTPWYGQQAGVTFDDPIMSQNRWATYRSLQLDGAQQERWNRIANSFTCDYCCGSPQNPTIITRCGCAHAAAAQGMAKWFVKNYGDSYPDEEIYGEMARWYALWYPKGTIERIIQEAQAQA